MKSDAHHSRGCFSAQQDPVSILALAVLLAVIPSRGAPFTTISTCDDASQWMGGTVDRAEKIQGRGSIRWSHRTGRLTLVNPPLDWSSRGSVRFWLHSARATGTEFMFIVESGNASTPGADYWSRRIRVDFTGWREFLVDRDGMETTRKPKGWNAVTAVYFSAVGWGNTPDTSTVIRIDRFELTDGVPAGPRISDADFFAALSLDDPGLSRVRKFRVSGNLDSAKHALAAHFRGRTSVPWLFDPHAIDRTTPFDKHAADTTVAGCVQIAGIWHRFAAGVTDWRCNPTLADPDLFDDNEWQWQLNRMYSWEDLGRAYWATSDEKYGRTFAGQLRSWISQCPEPGNSGNYPQSSWRTIECGYRLSVSWPDAYHRFLLSPSFSDTDLVDFLKSTIEQARHIRDHSTSGNWLAWEMHGLYTAGALFPEFAEAAAWRAAAADTMYRQLAVQFLPDGAQIELTPGYHKAALDNIRAIADKADLFGRSRELPGDYRARMEKGYDYLLGIMTPDRSCPKLNDSWDMNMVRNMKEACPQFPHRTDFAWVATNGDSGAAPSPASRQFVYAGYCVMRSGWDRKATYVCFDAGPLGYGHRHEDKLHLIMYAFGREVLFDDGGGTYEESAYRDYATSTFGHNTVLVDGMPQVRTTGDRWAQVSRKPVDMRWESTEDYDFAVGIYADGYGRVDNRLATHERRVLFVKPDVVIVVDRITPHDGKTHTVQARWHLCSTATEVDPGTLAAVTSDTGKPNLAVIPLLPGTAVATASGQTTPEVLGWYVGKDKVNRRATTVTHTRSGKGVQWFLTLLVPVKPYARCPVVSLAHDAGSRQSTVKLRSGTVWQVSCGTHTPAQVRFSEISAASTLSRTVIAGR